MYALFMNRMWPCIIQYNYGVTALQYVGMVMILNTTDMTQKINSH